MVISHTDHLSQHYLSVQKLYIFSGSDSNPGQCIPLPSGACVFNLLSSRMFLSLILPFVTLTFVKAPRQYCAACPSLWVGLHFLITTFLSHISSRKIRDWSSLSLPGKRMLSLSPAVPQFDHLIKVVPAGYLHLWYWHLHGPSSVAVQWVLRGKVFWDHVNVLLLYRNSLILDSLRTLHWTMCFEGGCKSLIKQACARTYCFHFKEFIWRKHARQRFQSKDFHPIPHLREHGGLTRVDHMSNRCQDMRDSFYHTTPCGG